MSIDKKGRRPDGENGVSLKVKQFHRITSAGTSISHYCGCGGEFLGLKRFGDARKTGGEILKSHHPGAQLWGPESGQG